MTTFGDTSPKVAATPALIQDLSFPDRRCAVKPCRIPPGPLPQGVYDHPPDIARAIHDLEHAAVDIWYSPSAPASLVNRIKDFFSRSEEDCKVLVMPYDYNQPGGTLPTGKLMALAAWHHLQLCAQPSLAVAFQFVRSYRLDPHHIRQYKGDAREPTSGI